MHKTVLPPPIARDLVERMNTYSLSGFRCTEKQPALLAHGTHRSLCFNSGHRTPDQHHDPQLETHFAKQVARPKTTTLIAEDQAARAKA